jgi:hypothetical protein
MMLASAPVHAAFLQLTPATGTGGTLPGNFNPVGFPGGLVSTGDPITIYSSGDTGGLELAGGNATLNVEYLGSEAAFLNTFNFVPIAYSNAATPVGTTSQVDAATGILPFSFVTNGNGGGVAFNGGPINPGLSIAFAALNDGSFLALFNDGGGGDFDYDDLAVRISVSQVPLPAAAWLLISAILGLVACARIRRTGTQTA